MHEPLYRQALRNSWQLAWQHKLLWLFGFFALFLGQMGLIELFGKVLTSSQEWGFYPYWVVVPTTIINLLSLAGSSLYLSADVLVWSAWLILILLGLGIMGLFVAVASQGAIIKAAAQFAKKDKLPDTNEAWQAGTKHFWRLLVVNIIRKLVLILVAYWVGWSLFLVVGTSTVSQSMVFLLIFVLAVILGMIFSFLTIYAAGYIVVEDYGLLEALVASGKLFIKHWLVSFEVGIIILLANIVLGLVTIAGFLLLLLPTILLWFVGTLLGANIIWVFGIVLAVVIFLVFIAFLGSVFSVFVTSSWTYLFMKMHHEGVVSRILHWWRKSA